MSRESVELAKQGVDAFNKRDLDAFAETVTPVYEWVGAFLGIVEGGSYRGHEGMARYFAEAEETWEELNVSGDEFGTSATESSSSAEWRGVEGAAG